MYSYMFDYWPMQSGNLWEGYLVAAYGVAHKLLESHL